MTVLTRTKALIIFSHLCFLACLHPSAVGANTSIGTADLNHRLDGILENTLDYSPGALLYVSSPNVHYKKSIGLANKKTGLAMDPKFKMRIGSITKTYLAALAVMATQEERIRMDEPVAKYLPNWAKESLPLNHSAYSEATA